MSIPGLPARGASETAIAPSCSRVRANSGTWWYELGEGMPTTTTDRPDPRFARMYLRWSGNAEERGVREHRRRLLDGLSGRVVELGAGNGLNFAHYPAAVTEVVAVEP